MAKNKDFKRLVRARMSKTGESYTAARAVLVARPTRFLTTTSSRASAPSAERAPSTIKTATTSPSAAPQEEWPALAGMSDSALRAKTGRTWAEWVEVLDGARAYDMAHRDIAKHLVSAHGMPGWWNQMVAVGYERIRGLREVNQRRDGAFEANKSRTLPLSAAELFAWFHDARRRKRWLPDGPTKMRTSVPDKSLRFDWSDGTRVQVFLTAKGPGKTTASVQHTKLSAKEDIAKTKDFWAGRFDALSELISK